MDDMKGLHGRISPVFIFLDPTQKSHFQQLCLFPDVSTKANDAVSYLKVTDANGNNGEGLIMGKAKLTPCPEQTILRLEPCAAVLAVELADLISAELYLTLDAKTFHTDSKVVLRYIYNQTRSFYVYVCNRVLQIRRLKV